MDLLGNRLFACFTPSGSQALLEHIRELSLKNDEIIFEDGSVADGVYLLLKGKVQLSKASDDNRQIEIAVVDEDDYFGELGVLDGSPRSARATCKGEVRIAKIPSRHILKILHQEPVLTALRLFGRIEEHLRKTNDRFVEEVLRKGKLHLIGEMAGSIIHDFKNPITAIEGCAELIAHRHQDEATQKWCDLIVRQSDRMVIMVQELLDFTRGRVNLKTKIVAISALLEQFEILNQDFLKRSQIKLEICSSPVKVKMDMGHMMRVLQNLVMNAIEAIGEKKGEVRIFTNENKVFVELSVQDDGPGIPEEIRKTLFDPFVTYGKPNGTGLGMAISKMMVEAHRGEIFFETKTGKGTTFTIRLPKAKES